MANTNIPQIQAAITTMTNWITWAQTQMEAESGYQITQKYQEFLNAQIRAKQAAQDLLAIYAQKGIV
jgi:hypothetical protein